MTRRQRLLGLFGLGLLIAIYGWWPMIEGWKNTQGGDGQYFHRLIEAFRVSIVRYHELPLWDPYECGGRPLWDNPQGLAGAPLIWLSIWTGTSVAMKIWYLVHIAGGFVSMWLFCRDDLKVSRAACMAGAVAWALTGFHSHHYSGGHTAFVTFELMPLALYLWRRAEGRDTYAVALGLLVALLGFEGSALPLLYFAVLLGAETITRLWPKKRIFDIVRAGAITVVVGLGVGAVRLFPVIDQLRSHKRPIPPDTDHMTLSSTIDAFVNANYAHLAHLPNHIYVWGEYACYVGWALALLGIAGMITTWRTHLWLTVLFALAVVLMIGNQGHLSPWTILNTYVYPLKEMRVPARFNAQASFLLIALATLGIDRLTALAPRLEKWVPKAVLAGVQIVIPFIGLVGAGDVAGKNITLAHEFPIGAPMGAIKPSPHIWYGGPAPAGYIEGPQQNRGRVQCYEPWAPYEGAPVWEGDVPQAKPAPGSLVTVSNVTRTQNTFDFDVQADAPGKVLLDSSFDLNWRSTVGTPAVENNLLTLDVPEGVHHVHVYYRPRYLLLGFLVTVLAIAGLVWAVKKKKLRDREAPSAADTPDEGGTDRA